MPEQQLQLANIHRFTPSCVRCRKKKLKCDTNLPCNQCIAKGVHDDCRKDDRIPRGRKRPKLATASSFDKPEDEIASLRKRVEELEQMVVRQNEPLSPSASHQTSDKRSLSSHKLGTDSRASQTTAPSDLGLSNSRGHHSSTPTSLDSDVEDELGGDTENSLVTLEKLAASDPRVSEPGHGKAMHKQINNVHSTRIAPDAPNPYFAQPALLNERIDILVLAKRIVPEKHLVDVLIETFNLRCHVLAGRIIHMPFFQRDIDFFTASSIDEVMTSPLGMYDLARYFMILRLGLRFYPWKGNQYIDDTSPEFIAVNALKNRGDDIAGQWLNLAKRALAADKTFSLGSLKAIQTALLMVLDGRDSPSYLRMLLRISIQTALDMGLHRLGDAMPSHRDAEEDIVRLETGVRIWWYLVVKDWCSAQREGAYTIHPSQMTTRRPLHTTDARLSQGRTDEISFDVDCETSYTLCQIQLASIIRESIDLRNEQSTLGGTYDVISPTNRKLLHSKIECFLSDLPPFYRLEAELKPCYVAVQRCLLHQQAFDMLLKLNRKNLANVGERDLCTKLAEQVVATQGLIRSLCPVIDGFWVNYLHLFGATLTLMVSLLLDEGLSAEMREKRRSSVEGALGRMRDTPGSDRGARVIDLLLKEEQRVWDQPGRRPLDLATLTRRIVAQTTDARDSPSGREVLWDTTPDEGIIPAFASSWGTVSVDPLDPMGLVGVTEVKRSYEHSLRPWAEPSPTEEAEEESNGLWDWVFSQAALLHGPEPPTEGPPMRSPKEKEVLPKLQMQLPQSPRYVVPSVLTPPSAQQTVRSPSVYPPNPPRQSDSHRPMNERNSF